MSITVTPPSKPKGILKWVFLLPHYLYRWHLGWLLGHRCLMITHLGRKTGRKRQTVLEAVNYDPRTRACLAVAGYGEQTDWYRNIQAHPALEVQIGRQRYIPQQRFLSPEELLALLQDYERRHPRGLALLLRALGYPYDGTAEGLRAVAQVLRGVEFRPEIRSKEV
jgi:deazaflavin-dependent oxidoreductase (nitroreductase family)